jgi:hypothetical protein
MKLEKMTYDFTLLFQLPADGLGPVKWVDVLFEAGCNDATVGVGRSGVIALNFSREAKQLDAARSSAILDVESAIPDAKLIVIAE